MRIFFKKKVWIVIQAIMFLTGMIIALALKAKGMVIGAIPAFLQFTARPQELTLPLLLILLSDLALNTEVLEGTLMTHILTGKRQSEWFAKKLLLFSIFIIIQFFLAGFFVGVGTLMVNGKFTTQVAAHAGIVSSNPTVGILFKGIFMNALKSLAYVSLAVFVSTLLPGRLFVGSAISFGALIVSMKVFDSLIDATGHGKELIEILTMTNFDKSWWVAIIYIAVFWGLSYLRMGRMKLTNEGV